LHQPNQSIKYEEIKEAQSQKGAVNTAQRLFTEQIDRWATSGVGQRSTMFRAVTRVSWLAIYKVLKALFLFYFWPFFPAKQMMALVLQGRKPAAAAAARAICINNRHTVWIYDLFHRLLLSPGCRWSACISIHQALTHLCHFL
jgi:hypothetical protein